MLNRYDLVRFFLNVVTMFFRIKNFNNEDKVVIQSKPIELKEEIVKAFQQVFSEPPWFEKWEREAVLAKINKELSGNSFLVVLRGNEISPVAGFCWGKILRIDGIENHVGLALGARPKGLEEVLKGLQRNEDDRVLYFHEFALLRQFRRGADPVKNLLIPGLQFGLKEGVIRTLFWTTPESKIFNLARYMGYREIFGTMYRGKKILFMYNKDFRPLLKVAQMDSRLIIKLLKITSAVI